MIIVRGRMKILKKKESIGLTIAVVLYLVGTIGILIPAFRNDILDLTFLHLLIVFFILFFTRKTKKTAFFIFLLFVITTSFLAEWLGVHTGILFGSYSYGQTLGWKISEIPFIIGVNWTLVTIGAVSILEYTSLSRYGKAIFAAALMTLLDYIMEPVAIALDFWKWETSSIPLYNYICWFLLALFFQWIYAKFNLNEKNKIHTSLFICMSVFFLVLNLFL